MVQARALPQTPAKTGPTPDAESPEKSPDLGSLFAAGETDPNDPRRLLHPATAAPTDARSSPIERRDAAIDGDPEPIAPPIGREVADPRDSEDLSSLERDGLRAPRGIGLAVLLSGLTWAVMLAAYELL